MALPPWRGAGWRRPARRSACPREAARYEGCVSLGGRRRSAAAAERRRRSRGAHGRASTAFVPRGRRCTYRFVFGLAMRFHFFFFVRGGVCHGVLLLCFF